MQSKQPAQAGDAPVGRRPSAAEDMGMVARFQPPFKVIVAHFRLFQGLSHPPIKGFGIFSLHRCRRLAPSSLARLDWSLCILIY